MTELEMEKFLLPNLVKKEDKDILSNEEVLKKLVASGTNLCFSKGLKDQIDFFFDSCGNSDVCGYKIVRLTLTDDMRQLMGELAISINEKLDNPLLNDHITAICDNLDKELQLRVAFNNFFTAIGEESKILLVLSNFYEHFAYISQADILRLQSFLSKCKQCRLWVCGDGEWYRGKHSVYLQFYRIFDPMYLPYYEAIKKGEKQPAVFLSYKWKGESIDVVDNLCDLFKRKQIYYKRDKKDCRYGDSITAFMDEIREGTFVVVMFSEAYLKSFNCVYELAGILNHPDYMKRIFPIVIDDTVRGENKYKELVNYWEKKKNDTMFIIRQIISGDKTVTLPLEKKVRFIEEYILQLQKLAEVTDEINSYSFGSLKECSYEPLLSKIKERLNVE